jgi:hypothetical protein
MNVGFTGTRKGMSHKQIEDFVNWMEDHYDDKLDEFHHGDCEGADEEAYDVARDYFTKIVVHPPIETKHRAYTVGEYWSLYMPREYGYRKPKEYLERNHDIVDETDILIAAPQTLEEELRSGTWATIRYARKMNKPIVILVP